MSVRIVKAILKDLCDRRGIKHEINAIDDYVREEMENSLATIVDKELGR